MQEAYLNPLLQWNRSPDQEAAHKKRLMDEYRKRTGIKRVAEAKHDGLVQA